MASEWNVKDARAAMVADVNQRIGENEDTRWCLEHHLKLAYRAGLERAGEIATNHRAAVPPECVSEVEKYGREIADAIRKEAGR